MLIQTSRQKETKTDRIKVKPSELLNANSWIKNVLPSHFEYSYGRENELAKSVKEKYCSFESKHTHAGFAHYLFYCWSKDKGVCLRPDMFWFRIISRTCKVILQNADKFRHIFTCLEAGKETLFIPNGDDAGINMELLDKMLESKVPNREFRNLIVETKFASQPENFDLAAKMCFANMAIPYYNYMETMCDIPVVDLQGNAEEWKQLYNRVTQLSTFLIAIDSKQAGYFTQCLDALNDIMYYGFLENKVKLKPKLKKISVQKNNTFVGFAYVSSSYTSTEDFFSDIFWMQGICASGHPDNACHGWFSKFYATGDNLLEIPD